MKPKDGGERDRAQSLSLCASWAQPGLQAADSSPLLPLPLPLLPPAQLSDSMAVLSLAGSAGQPAAAPPASPTAAAAPAPKPAAAAQPKPAGPKRAAAAKPAKGLLLDVAASPLPAERAATLAAQHARAVAAGKKGEAARILRQFNGEREGAGSKWAEKPGAAAAMAPPSKLSDLAVVYRRAALRVRRAGRQLGRPGAALPCPACLACPGPSMPHQ